MRADAINEATSWLDNNQEAEKEFEAKQKALESVILPILQNLSGAAEPDGFLGGGFLSDGPSASSADDLLRTIFVVVVVMMMKVKVWQGLMELLEFWSSSVRLEHPLHHHNHNKIVIQIPK
jgi:hypothetical protein